MTRLPTFVSHKNDPLGLAIITVLRVSKIIQQNMIRISSRCRRAGDVKHDAVVFIQTELLRSFVIVHGDVRLILSFCA